MKIGIIGSGNIGATTARLFANAGHQVAISNSHSPESLTPLVSSIGANVTPMTVEETAKFGEVVLLAIPWRKRQELPSPELFEGKIVIDATNPYSSTGTMLDLGNSTSSEEVAKQIPGASIVKAFNTMYYETLRTRARKSKDDRLVLFLAGDDSDAKAVVSSLIEDIGFTPVDTGALRDGGRKQQPGSGIYNNPVSVEVARKLLRELR
jgi:8-hydroxy-5-deazaflavin:NADPH oxidoreductase